MRVGACGMWACAHGNAKAKAESTPSHPPQAIHRHSGLDAGCSIRSSPYGREARYLTSGGHQVPQKNL
eukprot:scaffold14363_cov111-Isochrysis_galbana.AAC.6